ncbi:MAG: glycosyltransferase family 2 protein [Bacteroidales bacterium]|nr:glycosyltransferase family 2 protein [Bacteroidales bacterium]
MKFSIITPCFNAENFIEDAIKSVLSQEGVDLEHIVVDGGSNDRTIEILKKYTHVKWISEKDRGQSDAMNKGFEMSTGDIIGYLNADDYYMPDIFKIVLKYFNQGAYFVQGKIKVEREDKTYFLNDGKTKFDKIIRHWDPQAFCVNPVGYFYRREVQESIGGFDIRNNYSMDLQFLLAVSSNYKMTRVEENIILGVFRYYNNTKTAKNQSSKAMWNTSTFWYIDDYLKKMNSAERIAFVNERERGYKMKSKEVDLEKMPLFLKIRKKIIEKVKNVWTEFRS